MEEAGRTRHRLPVRLDRDAPRPALEPFLDHFQGFEEVEAVRAIFGEKTRKTLETLKIGFVPNRRMYMGIRDVDGNLAVGTYHLRTSPVRTLYLDIIHELFHIKQRTDDERFFHREFMKFVKDRSLYYASPIEIPAYQYTVREAERIGMNRDEILDYLKIGEAPARTWEKFVDAMKLSDKVDPSRKIVEEFPVRINREVTPRLYPFTRYFIDFHRVPAVKELFGAGTEGVLANLSVEFIDSPFPTIYPSEEDGHLVVAYDYFRKAAVSSVYLDVFLGLDMLKRSSREGKAGQADFAESETIFESYKAMVDEGRRLGVADTDILEHLTLLKFMLPSERYDEFLDGLGFRSATR